MWAKTVSYVKSCIMYCIKIVQFPPWMGCYSIVGLTPAAGWGIEGHLGGGGGGGVHMSLSSLSQIQLFHILRSRPFPWRYLTYLYTVGRLMPFSSSLMCSCFKAKLLVRIYPKRASMLSVFIYTPGWRETKRSKVSSLRTQCNDKVWTWPSWSEVQVCNCSAPPLLPPSSQKR